MILGGLNRLTKFTETPNILKKEKKQNAGAKVRVQEGNSPEQKLRF
jgi:hypothetical protein